MFQGYTITDIHKRRGKATTVEYEAILKVWSHIDYQGVQSNKGIVTTRLFHMGKPGYNW
jgi:hypothetical protein